MLEGFLVTNLAKYNRKMMKLGDLCMYLLSKYYLLQLTRWEISPWAVTLSVSQTILFIGYVLISLRNSDAASMNISNPVYVLSPLPFYSISISASPICGA